MNPIEGMLFGLIIANSGAIVVAIHIKYRANSRDRLKTIDKCDGVLDVLIPIHIILISLNLFLPILK